MVSRAEFASALDAVKIPTFALMEMAPASFKPNVEVSKAAGPELSFAQTLVGDAVRRFGLPHLAPISAAARAAVGAARESLERRLARALKSARVLEGDSLDICLGGMHAILDAHGYPRHDRFVALPAAVFDKMAGSEDFGAAPFVWVMAKVWRDMIWVRSRHLDEVQAVMFHRGAIEGRIEPLDPSRGQVASAEVVVRVVEPEGVRILRWPVAR